MRALVREGGRVAPGTVVATVEGAHARHPHRRAHGAQLPPAPLGHRDGRGAVRGGPRGDRRAASRHEEDGAGHARAREAGRGARRRDEPPHGPLGHGARQGQPHRGRRRYRARRRPRARRPPGHGDRGRGDDARRAPRGARRGRGPRHARQHAGRCDARGDPGRARGRPPARDRDLGRREPREPPGARRAPSRLHLRRSDHALRARPRPEPRARGEGA